MRKWLIWKLLLWADEMICNLPTPPRPYGPEFEEWGDLGDVHAAIDKAYSPQ